MGLDSFNKKSTLSRREFLRRGGALAAAPALNVLPPIEIPAAAPLVQPESIPAPESVTEEEVHTVLRNLLENTPYDETRKLADGAGLYLLDVKVAQDDGYKEYSYRKGRPAKGELPGYRIDMTIYDATGFPTGGYSAAKKIEGIWKLTP